MAAHASAARRGPRQLAGVLSRTTCRRAIPPSTGTTSSPPIRGPAATGWRWSSERGFVALALLALVGGSIALGAWARIRRGAAGRRRRCADLTIVATLLAVAVVGAFDAVLLLPVPTLFAWTHHRRARPRPRVPIRRDPAHLAARRAAHDRGRRWSARCSSGGARRRPSRWACSPTASARAMESALTIDPGSYRIRMLLGRAWARAGRCDRAVPHANAARELFPNHPAPGAARCARAASARADSAAAEA